MAGDTSYNNVVLLLHCNGANGSTTFTDNSPTPKTVTANGNAQISTAQSKFGGSSALFDGTGDYLSIPSSSDFDFGSGDFTIEVWAMLNTIVGSHHLIAKYGATATAPFALYQSASSVQFYASSNGSSWDLLAGVDVGTGLTTGVFYHLAVTRQGNTWRTFLNGSLTTTVTASGVVVSNSGALMVGRGSSGAPQEFNGYLDDVRITKGVARYTASFTPTTAAFPDYTPFISGNVKDDAGANCARTVYAYRRDTGALVASTVSNAGTGNYTFTTTYDGVHTLVFLDDVAGTTYNALVLDQIVPI